MRGRVLRGVGRWAVRVLAALGLVAVVVTTIGVVADVQSFDRTSGGYEPPYEGWTGTPIDWESQHVTDTGFYGPGRVIDTSLDCTSGMIHFYVFGFRGEFRELSERAEVVHRPREACEAAGFDPRF